MNRRSFLTGAASCATLAATGGIGAARGDPWDGRYLTNAQQVSIQVQSADLGDMVYRSGQLWFTPTGGATRLLGEVTVEQAIVDAMADDRCQSLVIQLPSQGFELSTHGEPYLIQGIDQAQGREQGERPVRHEIVMLEDRTS